MKTKAEIVQNLLNEGKISAEDAVVLLKENGVKEYIVVKEWIHSQPNTLPFIPLPDQPFWTVTCGSSNGATFNVN